MFDSVLNIKDFGAKGDGTNDDTAAIQAAINYAITNLPDGAVIYAPYSIGHYMIKGAVQSAGGANAQLVIPPSVGWPSRAATIKFMGPILPSQSMCILVTGGNIDGGAVYESTITGPGGSAAILGSYRADTGAPGFNTVTVDFENITFQAKPNPQLIGLNMRTVNAFRARGLKVWTGVSPFDVSSAPTLATSVAIATPTNNNAAFTRLDDCSVSGFYTGYEINEHTTGDNNSVFACYQGATIGFAYHASHLTRFMTVHCPFGLVWTAAARLTIDQYDVEHLNGNWKAPILDIVDNKNLGHAQIVWAAVLGNVGVDHSFGVTGTNIWTKEVGTEPFIRGTNAQVVLTPSLPPDQAGIPLLASWDVDGITNLNNTGISFLPDQSTNGYHLLPSSGNRATAVYSDLNGHTTADFGTSFITMVNSAYAASQPMEVFFVSKITDGQTYYNGMFDANTSSRLGICADSATGLIDFFTSTKFIQGPVMPKNKWIVYDMVYDGTNSALYTNGVLCATGDLGTQSMSGFLLNGIYNYPGHTTIQKIARVDAFAASLGSSAFAPARSNQFFFITNRYKFTTP